MLTIDGALGEGGGQTVRLALALGALTRQPVEIKNIRQNRRAPGLRADLIAIAKAMAAITRGRVEGDDVGSHELRFLPATAISGSFEFTIPYDGTARGSVTHLLQTALPTLLFAGARSELVLTGATHVAKSPAATYIQTVFLPTLRKFGVRCEVVTESWGWGAGVPGRLRLRVEPVLALNAADLMQRGQLLQIGGSSVASGLGENFAERQRHWTSRRVSELGSTATINVQTVPSESTGSMLFLLAVFERAFAGFTALSSAGEAAEQVSDNAVKELRSYLLTYKVVDKHLADQLLIYGALAEGVTTFSTSELTLHTASAAEIIQSVLGTRITIDGVVGEPADIEIFGVGATR